jgi:hypothetical protein
MTVIESPNVRELNATPTQMLGAADMRPLEGGELDAVNGGIIPVLVGIGVGIMLFEVGMIVGMGAANYKYTGSVWGR